MPRLLAVALSGALLLSATVVPATAQPEELPKPPEEFNSGDIKFRTYTYMRYAKVLGLPFTFYPGEGLSGIYFQDKPDGTRGWTRWIEQEQGMNGFALDHLATGRSLPPPDDDFVMLLEKALYGVYQLGMATRPEFALAHGFAAGMLIKARSIDSDVGRALVLVDPIGPQFSQPMTTRTPAEELARLREGRDGIWRRWGFGPRYGELRRGLDLSRAAAESLVNAYDHGQPAYWAGLLTSMDSGLQVREAFKLAGVPVLVIRTPAADRAQVEREEAVVRWMQERGMVVSRLDLGRDPELRRVSGLPWAGDLSDAVIERIFGWYLGLGLPERTDGIGR